MHLSARFPPVIINSEPGFEPIERDRMSPEEEESSSRRIPGSTETIPENESPCALPLDPFRTDSNLSEGRHLSNSSSSTYVSRLSEGSEPLSRAQTKRSSRAPSAIFHERNRLRFNCSQLAVPIEEDGISIGSRKDGMNSAMEPVTPVLGTDHRLQQFEMVTDRETSSHPELVQQRRKRREEIQRRQEVASMHRLTLKSLQARVSEEVGQATSIGHSNPFVRTLSNAFSPGGNKLRKENELIKLAHHFYPPVGEMEVHVFDFGPNYSRHTTTTLGSIEDSFGSKPKEVKVRWIHVSLGVGVTHSSVEEIFQKAEPGPGKPFMRAGGAIWPTLVDTILEFHHKNHFKKKRDALLLLRNRHDLSNTLDNTLFSGVKNDNLRIDMQWRCDHINTEMSFWNIAQSQLPHQLSESIIMGGGGPRDGLKPVDQTITEQMFSRHPFYKQARARLVKTQFRTFHRDDGCLLTLSPMCGVNYLGKDLATKLKEPPECRILDESTSALARVWQVFEKTGTSTWPSESVEWFLVYLMTEVSATPHTISEGFNAPSLPQAYEAVALDLKRRRLERFRRNAAVVLVRDYIACIEELSTISKTLEKKRSFLQRLRQDCKQLEGEVMMEPRRSDTNIQIEKSMVERVDWALDIVTEQDDFTRSILEDLQSSMQALFQLKSVEQNELAIIADSQNKAILIFTGVTIIFLPLSFFTSYFGMNLKGVINTEHSEGYFWAVCGSIGLFLLIFILPIAFRHEIRHVLRKETNENYDSNSDDEDDDDEVMTSKKSRSQNRDSNDGKSSWLGWLMRRLFIRKAYLGNRTSNEGGKSSPSISKKFANHHSDGDV